MDNFEAFDGGFEANWKDTADQLRKENHRLVQDQRKMSAHWNETLTAKNNEIKRIKNEYESVHREYGSLLNENKQMMNEVSR